jgi:RNA polymerase sigma factor (sigma-70 family)
MSSAQVDPLLRFIRQLAVGRKDSEVPDHQLLERFAASGDEAAFTALLRRHGPMVLSVCQSILHNLHDAEDVFQAAFLVLARKAGSIQRREAVSSWLYRVAYRLAVKAQASVARRKDHEKRAAAPPSAEPLLDMSLRELRDILNEELDLLPEQYRAPLVLCGLEEKSLEEAGRLLGWSKSCIKGRLQRGREQLRARLRRRGVELSTGLLAALTVNSLSAQVSVPLTASTLRAALQIAAGGELAAGAISANVVALVRGAMPTMFTSKFKIATLIVLTLGVSAAGLGELAQRESASQSTEPPAKEIAPSAKPQRAEIAEPVHREDKDTLTLSGRVLNPEGKPLAGAKLYLAKPATLIRNENKPALSHRATSGSDGRFRFAVPKRELDYNAQEKSQPQIMTSADGYGCDWTAIEPAQKEITLRLVKDATIHMRILDAGGKSASGVKVTVKKIWTPKGDDLDSYLAAIRNYEASVSGKEWHGPLPDRASAITGRDGRFYLAGAGRDRIVHLHIAGSGIATAEFYVMTRKAESVARPQDRRSGNGTIKIYGAASDYVAGVSRPIRGVVRDKQTGKPLAGVFVGDYLDWAKTDERGRYELLGLAKAEHYRLVAEPSDGLHFQRGIKLQDTPGLDALTCDIELVQWLMVRGRVTEKETGKPVKGAEVVYHPLGGNSYVNKLLPGYWRPRSKAVANSDGSYALTVLPGPGAITVTAPRRYQYMPAAVTFAERKDFFKTPLVYDDNENALPTASGDGGFGGISLSGFNAVVLLEPGEKEETLVRDAALRRPLERKGRVVDPDGQPIIGVRVYSPVLRNNAETLKGDEFTLRGINPKANVPLIFYHKEKQLGYYVKDLRGEKAGPLVIKLQTCGSASGRILDPDGRPVAGLHGMLERHYSYGPRGGSVDGAAEGGSQQVLTDKDGRFRVEGLIPGQEYRVANHSASRPGFLDLFVAVMVKPGEHKDMGDLKMSKIE